MALIRPQPWLPDDRDRSFRTVSATLTLDVAPVLSPLARALACAAIGWAASNRFPGLAFGAIAHPVTPPIQGSMHLPSFVPAVRDQLGLVATAQ